MKDLAGAFTVGASFIVPLRLLPLNASGLLKARQHLNKLQGTGRAPENSDHFHWKHS